MVRQSIISATLGCIIFLLPLPKALAEPETFSIDSNHTHISFSVDRFGFAKTIGVFPDSGGTITLDEDHPERSTVTAYVDTATVWTGLALRDEVVRGSTWLNSTKYDKITFQSKKIDLNTEDKNKASVTGELMLWGQKHPVTFDVTLNQIAPDRTAQGRKAAGFSMHTTLKRSTFGHQVALGFVGDEVSITIETIAHRKE